MFNIDADYSLIDSGAWLSYKGSKFLVTHISNTKFQKVLAKLQFPYRRKIDAGTLDPDISRAVMCQAMSEAMILDWQDVKSKDGPVKFTPELAYKALMKDPEFRDIIAEFSANIDNFRKDELNALGNS